MEQKETDLKMSISKRRVMLPVIILVIMLSGASSFGRAIDRTIAKINDDIITESDLAEIVADVSGQFNSRFVSAFDTATSENVMSMFDRALLLQEARRMKVSPAGDELHSQVESMVNDIRANFASDKEFHQALAAEHISLEQLKKELLKKVKTDYMVFHVVNSRFSVSEEDVQRFKAAQTAGGEVVESFRLRRMGVPVKESGGVDAACREARALVARTITEGISFEEGVRRYSKVPGAAADGGDMGYMSSDKLSSEVKSAVEDLQVGQASAPVVAGGYANIFYIDGKRGPRSALREQKFFEARDELLNTLRRKALLQIFDKRLLKILPQEYQASLSSPATGHPKSRVTNPVGETLAPGMDRQNDEQVQPVFHQYPPQATPAATPPQVPRRFPRWFGNRQ